MTTKEAAELLLRAIDLIPRPKKAMDVACQLLGVDTEKGFRELRALVGDEAIVDMFDKSLIAGVDQATGFVEERGGKQ